MERDNMPSGFQPAFLTAGAAFNTAWANFIAKEKAVSTGTDAVDNAIQQVLVELLPMLELGRRIFIFEPEQRKLFTVADLKAQVQSDHQAGVKGRVTEVGSGRLLMGVKVAAMVEGQERMAETDKTGRYVLKLPNGVYDLVFSLPGMEPSAVAGRLVQPGVMGRLNLEMRPVPVLSH